MDYRNGNSYIIMYEKNNHDEKGLTYRYNYILVLG